MAPLLRIISTNIRHESFKILKIISLLSGGHSKRQGWGINQKVNQWVDLILIEENIIFILFAIP